MKRFFVWTLWLLAAGHFGMIARGNDETPNTWFSDGQRAIAEAKKRIPNNSRAKNIILFVGDGMGISTITAARILEGQLRGENGEENLLSFEKLPYSALSKTYSVNQQVSDSAPTMTAMVTGVKTKDAMLSVNQFAERGNYKTVSGNELPTFLEIAKRAGKSVGLVTTTRITHATPAACYAHSPERDWESDADLPSEARNANFPDIARQLIEFQIGGGIDVALGGGREQFLPQEMADFAGNTKFGNRLDERNLIKEWTNKTSGTFVWNRAQFDAVVPATTKRLLGLFNHSHMEFEHDRVQQNADEPSLSEMTVKAIEILAQNEKGFFLMVEGGRIDHGHHNGNAFRALTETIEFSRAIEIALKKIDLEETLVIVTADHSHTLTLSGYPKRGNDILGLVVGNEISAQSVLGSDTDGLGLPYATLNYANGPGYSGASCEQGEGTKQFPHEPKSFSRASSKRPDLKSIDTAHPDYLQEALFPRKTETHGGEDVAIFAGGPSAHLFRGVVEQNFIFHVMLEAAQLSPMVGSNQISSVVLTPQGN